MDQIIQVQDTFNNGLSGSLDIVDFETRPPTEKQIQLNSRGEVEVNLEEFSDKTIVIARPDCGYWATHRRYDELEAPIICEKIKHEFETWAFKFLAPKGVLRSRQSKKLRIAIIDVGPFNRPNNSSVTCINIDGFTISSNDTSSEPSHGEKTSSLLINFLDYLGADYELILCDARRVFKNGLLLSEINEAISLLSEHFELDVISISAGVFPEQVKDSRFLATKEAIECALENGTVCICAAGNDPSQSVAAPARLFKSIGVGSMGIIGVYPVNSYAYSIGEQSIDDKLDATISGLGHLFLNCNTNYGIGVNVVSPGVGVIFSCRETAQDYEGTSFSTPLVAVLAASGNASSPKVKSNNAKKTLRALRDMRMHIDLEAENVKLSVPRLTNYLKNDNILLFRGNNE